MLACYRFFLAGISILSYLFLYLLVRAYQLWLSPWLGPRCRYEPTCSHYMLQSIDRYGPFQGFLRGVKRLLRCHPWGGSGWDPP